MFCIILAEKKFSKNLHSYMSFGRLLTRLSQELSLGRGTRWTEIRGRCWRVGSDPEGVLGHGYGRCPQKPEICTGGGREQNGLSHLPSESSGWQSSMDRKEDISETTGGGTFCYKEKCCKEHQKWRHRPVIPAAWETEIGGAQVQGKPE